MRSIYNKYDETFTEWGIVNDDADITFGSNFGHDSEPTIEEELELIEKRLALLKDAILGIKTKKVKNSELDELDLQVISCNRQLYKISSINKEIKSDITKPMFKLIKDLAKELETIKQAKIKETFRKRLVGLLITNNKSNSDLEKLLCVSQQTISSYVNNGMLPTESKLIKIAEYLNCSADYLINEEINETEVLNDHIYNDIGLDTQSIKFLRSRKKDNKSIFYDISFTLNALIHHHYRNTTSDLTTDVLTAITEYLKISQSKSDLYTVSDGNLSILKDWINEAKSPEDISSVMNQFKIMLYDESLLRINTVTDFQNLHLKNIEDKLRNVYKELSNEYYEYTKALENE